MRDFALIGAVFIIALVSLRRPVFGLLSFICFGIVNPHSNTWTTSQTFHSSQMIAAGTILGYVFGSERKRFPRERELVLLLGLWGMFALSSWFAIYPARAVTYFMHVSKILVMVFLALSLLNTEYRLHLLVRTLALSLGYFAVGGGIFAIVTGGQYMVWGPEDSFLEANNAIGLALAINLPLLFYLLKVETYQWLRRIIRAMIILSYPAIICTYSRGAWLGLATATVLIALRSRYRVRILVLLALLTVLIVPILDQVVPERVVRRYNDLVNYEQEGSAQTRLWTWEFCKRVGLGKPLTGGGFDFYSLEVYARYYPEFIEWRGGVVASCHSSWMTVLAEHGVPGFMLWISLVGCCFLSLRRLRLHASYHDGKLDITYCSQMLEVALITYLLTGTFVDIAYFDLFYYLVAVIIIIKERIAQEQTKDLRGEMQTYGHTGARLLTTVT